jgi:hypothetical protein
MPDNVVANAGAGGETFATDKNASEGAHWPITKMGWGARDSAYNVVDIASGKPLPVQLRSSAGTEIGTVANPLQVTPQGGPSGLSLSGATAPGAGTAIDLKGARDKIAMQVSYTSNPTAIVVNLEITIDGTNWQQVATFNGGSGGTDATGKIIASVGVPALQARANVTTITGGTSPAVTANIAAV